MEKYFNYTLSFERAVKFLPVTISFPKEFNSHDKGPKVGLKEYPGLRRIRPKKEKKEKKKQNHARRTTSGREKSEKEAQLPGQPSREKRRREVVVELDCTVVAKLLALPFITELS